jgi:hypothetical protein
MFNFEILQQPFNVICSHMLHFDQINNNQKALRSICKVLILFYFLWPMHLFPLSTHKECILSHLIHNSTAMFSLKNLMPWRDSNLGLLVQEAEAKSTAPRRHARVAFVKFDQ